jgi:hypothetical protein
VRRWIDAIGSATVITSVHYYHCSDRLHPDGLRLTGSATRGEASKWSHVPGFDGTRVYIFVGSDVHVEQLRDSTACGDQSYLYEVEPEGELVLDHAGGAWTAASCETAIVRGCIHRPATR